ncbi:hypothetical protein HMPREF9440_01946 [Sutterella parvirubra YIT 11816]|uniref:Uncharacterized protein n=1 Tax=Sutterella parvirubra YIT 11816 TaxID=762967 RepID=H3KGR4_9BURK|nr:hypothetical protein HMPREF9440_01946 [Sutterella parvirubra YIT 11816]
MRLASPPRGSSPPKTASTDLRFPLMARRPGVKAPDGRTRPAAA